MPCVLAAQRVRARAGAAGGYSRLSRLGWEVRG